MCTILGPRMEYTRHHVQLAVPDSLMINNFIIDFSAKRIFKSSKGKSQGGQLLPPKLVHILRAFCFYNIREQNNKGHKYFISFINLIRLSQNIDLNSEGDHSSYRRQLDKALSELRKLMPSSIVNRVGRGWRLAHNVIRRDGTDFNFNVNFARHPEDVVFDIYIKICCHSEWYNRGKNKVDGKDCGKFTIENSDLSWIDFSKMGKNLSDIRAKYCNLQGCNFSNTTLNGAWFLGSNVRDCLFHNAEADGVYFQETYLNGTVFSGDTTISRSDFSGANMEKVSCDPSVDTIDCILDDYAYRNLNSEIRDAFSRNSILLSGNVTYLMQDYSVKDRGDHEAILLTLCFFRDYLIELGLEETTKLLIEDAREDFRINLTLEVNKNDATAAKLALQNYTSLISGEATDEIHLSEAFKNKYEALRQIVGIIRSTKKTIGSDFKLFSDAIIAELKS